MNALVQSNYQSLPTGQLLHTVKYDHKGDSLILIDGGTLTKEELMMSRTGLLGTFNSGLEEVYQVEREDHTKVWLSSRTHKLIGIDNQVTSKEAIPTNEVAT